jgi:hypothetical protein
MIQIGKEYPAEGHDAQARGIAKRRAVYSICGAVPAPEQMVTIDRLERGFHGEWGGRDPYNEMRQAQVKGIEIWEEELCPDGKWRPVTNNDATITLGQAGAL